MVHTRSAAGRARRNYRPLDTGFAPPPGFFGVESSRPAVTPPPVFYGVESSNQHTGVPPPPWGFRGTYPRPARRSALWADFTDSDDEVLPVDAYTQTTKEQPTCMELLNTSLRIIASLCPPALLPDAQSLQVSHPTDLLIPIQHVQQLLLEPLLVEQLLVDAPSASKEVICTPPTVKDNICSPPPPLLVDAPLALKEVSDYQVYLTGDATTEIDTGNYYIGDDYAFTPDFAALEERFERLDNAHDLVILGNIQIEKRISALELDDPAPFTSAQLEVLSKDIHSTVTAILDPLIDMIIEKVNYLTDSNVQKTIGPITKALNCRLDIMEAILRDECEDEDAGGPQAQGEAIVKAIVQKSTKKSRSRRNRPKAQCSDLQNKADCFKSNSDKLQLKIVRHDDPHIQTICSLN